jgi:hypothetical protein
LRKLLVTRATATRTLIWSALAAVLVWLIASRSLVAYLADVAPEAALQLDPTNPRALLNMVESYLEVSIGADGRAFTTAAEPDGNETGRRLHILSQLARAAESAQATDASGEPPMALKPTREHLRRWTELALERDPLNARALRLLGQLADADGDEARASEFMHAAVQRSIREGVAVYWLMQERYKKADYRAALAFADTLLRTRSQVLPHVLPVLAGAAENPAAKEALKQLLAENPPWRSAFLAALPRGVTDARTPLEYLLALRETAAPPATADLGPYLGLLVEHKLYELAYYTWLQFLPPEQLATAGFLFNGAFTTDPTGLPFDWVIRAGAGASVDVVALQDDASKRALLVELGPGRVEFGTVTQLLLLAPGTYHFRGAYKGALTGRRGLVWRLSCAGADDAPIGQSPMVQGGGPGWRELTFAFTVLETNCRAQELKLTLDARMASEQLVSGSIWFTDLLIARD